MASTLTAGMNGLHLMINPNALLANIADLVMIGNILGLLGNAVTHMMNHGSPSARRVASEKADGKQDTHGFMMNASMQPLL